MEEKLKQHIEEYKLSLKKSEEEMQQKIIKNEELTKNIQLQARQQKQKMDCALKEAEDKIKVRDEKIRKITAREAQTETHFTEEIKKRDEENANYQSEMKELIHNKEIQYNNYVEEMQQKIKSSE